MSLPGFKTPRWLHIIYYSYLLTFIQVLHSPGPVAECLSCMCSRGAGTAATLVSGRREQQCVLGGLYREVALLVGVRTGTPNPDQAVSGSLGLSSPAGVLGLPLMSAPSLVSRLFSLCLLQVDPPAHHFCPSVSRQDPSPLPWPPELNLGLLLRDPLASSNPSAPVTQTPAALQLAHFEIKTLP